MPRLVDQNKEALVAFSSNKEPPALIAGSAVAAQPCSTARNYKMNSSPKPPNPAPDAQPGAVLVREAGLPYRPRSAADPFERWMALMEVVEALCPRWPARPPTPRGYMFKL